MKWGALNLHVLKHGYYYITGYFFELKKKAFIKQIQVYFKGWNKYIVHAVTGFLWLIYSWSMQAVMFMTC